MSVEPERCARLRELDQRERVACGGLQDAFSRVARELRRDRIEQPGGVRLVETLQSYLREVSRVEWALRFVTQGEEQYDRLRLDPARDEGEHLRRGGVEPVCVLDEQDEGRARRGIRDEVEGRERDQKDVRRRGRVGLHV